MRSLPIAAQSLAATFCGLLWVLFAGCAGKLEDPQRFVQTPCTECEDPAGCVAATCGLAGCHVAGNLLGTVDLVSPGVASRLLNQTTTMCVDGGVLVDPVDRSQSLLLDKLNPTPKCGEPMPFLRPPLSAADRACVATFVDQVVSGM